MLHTIERMNKIRDDAHVSSSSPGGGTAGEVCRLRLHGVFIDGRVKSNLKETQLFVCSTKLGLFVHKHYILTVLAYGMR